MKYYQQLAPIGVFSFQDAVKIIGDVSNTKKALKAMIGKGEISKIKRDLYAVIDLSTGDNFSNRFIIASKITDNSFISYHSAFEFYGFYNQTYNTVQVSSLNRFSNFTYDGYNYSYYQTNSDIEVEVIQGARVTSIERTVVDSINMLGKVMDVEELIKCLDLIHIIKEEKIKNMLLYYDKDILYRKVGYILSFYKEEFDLSDSFFDFCKSHSNIKNYGNISNGEIKKLEFISEWGLYGYRNLRRITNKGGDLDV